MAHPKFRLTWPSTNGVRNELTAIEPTLAEVKAHSTELAAAYNEPHNRSMMGHDPMSEAEVSSYYGESGAEGSRLFLLFRAGVLAGDADFRNLSGEGAGQGSAEFAFMIGGRSVQGKGLGTRFAILLHAFAFQTLQLASVYVTILSKNQASKRVFEKLGYHIDNSAPVRAHVDQDDDVTMSIGREKFLALHEASVREIQISQREGT